jgi:hypothetical protein
MDVDPESDNGEEAGAIDDPMDNYAGDRDNDSDSEDSSEELGRPGKRRRKNPAAPKPSNLHPDDPAHFLKLCTALKILVAREITDDQIEAAHHLLEAYCKELVPVGVCDVVPTFRLIRFWFLVVRRIRHPAQSSLCNSHSSMCS